MASAHCAPSEVSTKTDQLHRTHGRTKDLGTDQGPGTDQEPSTKHQGLTREDRKRLDVERKKQQRAAESLQKRIAELEARIADREARVKELESAMSAPGFYDDRDASKQLVDQHQTLMWEVGDLMGQWEALQEHASEHAAAGADQRRTES